MKDVRLRQSSLLFLSSGGEMGELIRSHDWSATPLGPPETWPQSLRTAVRVLLTSRHPMFIWWGPELIQFYNDAYRQTMGPERHPSALGQRGYACWEEIWTIIGPQIDFVMSGKGATWHEDQLVPVTRHGALQNVWWTYGYSPIDDEDGGVGGVLVVCQDVTEQHVSAENLRASEERLRTLSETLLSEREAVKEHNRKLISETSFLRSLFEQAPGFMAVLQGPDHVFALHNAAYSQLVGHRQIIGKTVRDALPEVEGQGFFELLDSVYATGKPFVGRGLQLFVTQQSGSSPEERFVDFVYQPITDVDDNILGIFVEGVDVTDRHTAEAAFRTIHQTLEEQVEKRTEELRKTEEILRHSQKMEAVGQLTGGIAHDFNNLLQGITSSLGAVQRRLAAGRMDGVERFISGAVASANRAAALTHRLLAFSRRQPLAPRPIRVNSLIASMEDIFRRTLGERVQLELAQAPDLWVTRCDQSQLENAILNLAINGRDAMPDGGILVVETRNRTFNQGGDANPDAPSGDYVCIRISDTGSGMPPEVVARAFDPFFTTKPTGQGTGLGLSMVYGFAHQSDGHVSIRSQIGQGTTVELLLPRFAGEADADPKREIGIPAIAPAPPGRTVLVVEDEPVVRQRIAELFIELGYSVLEASDGPSGLQLLLSDRRIDLLLTDVGLPGLNGRQIADAGRQRRANLKVLFMTGYAEKATMDSNDFEPGMELITKPFGLDTLAARVSAMLDPG